MSGSHSYHVVLFKSVNQTMWADKILKAKGLIHKLIPMPRHISSDCGVCIRILSEDIETVRMVLIGIEGFIDIVAL